jgi:hypothetical protein
MSYEFVGLSAMAVFLARGGDTVLARDSDEIEHES